MELLVRFLISTAFVSIFIASQLFWIRQFAAWGGRLVSHATLRRWLGGLGVILFVFLFAYNLVWAQAARSPTHLTLQAALLEAPFRWWMVSSILGFVVAMLFWIADRIARAGGWAYRKLKPAGNPSPKALISPARRRFLEQTAVAVSAAPFVAGAYGLFYGRLNLETTRQRIPLLRLPRAFDGIRIAQISDVHIGPFMPFEEIRKYTGITNELKPDLVVLTGDYVTWDPSTQKDVVLALSGLRSPLGVFGCLGNHEIWSEIEESITRLFASRGIRILRQERAAISLRGETLNLVGVDYQSTRGSRTHRGHLVPRYLPGMESAVMPETVNILLTHNPNAFDRAAEMGFDLSLAGHTHGGQVTLEFIHPSLTPSRLITDYVKGHFQKGNAQLYVNRGIGTIGVPMRLGSPPEITLLELVRQG